MTSVRPDAPHTPQERLLWAYRFGHAWNRAPKYANLRNLDTGRILTMNGDEPDARLLIGSWQDYEPNVYRLVLQLLGRELQPDGVIGPASEMAMQIKRCGLPDFAPPPEADEAELAAMYEDDDLRGAIESYKRYAEYRNNDKDFVGPEGSWPAEEARVEPAEYVGGSGSWPKGCDPKRKDVHSTRVSLLQAGFSSHQRSFMAEVVAACERCPAQMGLSNRYVLDGDPADAEHDVRGQNMPGGVIGFAYFPQVGTCNQTVVARIDNTFNASKYAVAELFEHEQGGHSRGKEHRSRTSAKKSIMHPSIGNPADWPTWIDDAGEFEMAKWFGGIPVPPLAPPVPVPAPGPPPVGQLVFRGHFTAELDGKPLGNFILAPKPEV